ncbi:MAG: hypothetical protein ABI364_04955 [Caldimonas sp.]
MTRSFSFPFSFSLPFPASRCRVAAGASLLVLASVGVGAQTRPKPPPRLPPNAAEAARIPAGVDTGSPTTSDSLSLGTPVPPAIGVDRRDERARSAAARAAVRPKPAASGADCTNRLAPESPAGDGKAKPVALPKSGFTGSSTPPSTAGQTPLARRTGRLDC